MTWVVLAATAPLEAKNAGGTVAAISCDQSLSNDTSPMPWAAWSSQRNIINTLDHKNVESEGRVIRVPDFLMEWGLAKLVPPKLFLFYAAVSDPAR
jgi:hypothetical protein